MLTSRTHGNPLARARLSHAIRSSTSEENWLFVSSANIDELIQQPLPGIDQQIQYLARWLGAQLADDRLGYVCPNPELLAGLVGAVDGERVERLIDYAVRKGLVERSSESDEIGLTPEGWQTIAPRPRPADTKPMTVESEIASKIVKAHCNVCGPERNAYKRASHCVNGDDSEVSWSNTYDVLECCGCNGISVRHTHWFSEWDYMDNDPLTGQPQMIPGVKVTFWPPPTQRKPPNWAEKIGDNVLRGVMEEVYQALNSGMIVLASIGTRTLLDRAMFLRVGDPKGGFAGKLACMVEKGHIGNDEKAILEAITDAGSASAHRGFAPTTQTLDTIMDTVENFLHREFVLKTAAGAVKTATPPRRRDGS